MSVKIISGVMLTLALCVSSWRIALAQQSVKITYKDVNFKPLCRLENRTEASYFMENGDSLKVDYGLDVQYKYGYDSLTNYITDEYIERFFQYNEHEYNIPRATIFVLFDKDLNMLEVRAMSHPKATYINEELLYIYSVFTTIVRETEGQWVWRPDAIRRDRYVRLIIFRII